MNYSDIYAEGALTKMSDCLGLVVTSVNKNPADADVFIELNLSDGRSIKFFHYQDCCENVHLEDVDGDWDDIIGSPITMAEDVSSEAPDGPIDSYDESHTWTFYRLATIKGYVTLRFYGTSNGYYSESVDVLIS